MLFHPESIPLDFHAFPGVEQESNISQLEPHDLCSRIDSHKRAILDFEDKIKWHQKAIAQYRGYLNIVESRINVLMPQELLREIFKHLMWSSIPWVLLTCSSPLHVNQIGHTSSRGEWLKVALVCRYWRSVTLSLRELFSYAHIRATGGTSEVSRLLEYSQPSPLYVSTDIVNSAVLDAIVPHATRIVAIRIAELGKRPFDEWPAFHTTKSLVCSFSDDTKMKRMNDFLARFPNLERLHLTADTIVPCASLPLLTHLSLLFCEVSQKKFFQMLHLLPQLKVLELCCVHLRLSKTSFATPTRPLNRLVLLLGGEDDSEYATILKVLPKPKVLQIGPSWYFGHSYPDLDWIHTAIQQHHTHALDLIFDNGYPMIESRRSPGNATSGTSLGIPDETHNSTNVPPKSVSFNVNTLTIHSMPQDQHRAVFGILRTLSPLKIQTIRMPGQPFAQDHPLCTGYDQLQNLYISTDSGSRLSHLQWVKDLIQTRQRTKRPDLEFLCLESSHSSSLWGDEGPDEVRERDAIIESLRASTRELRLSARAGMRC